MNLGKPDYGNGPCGARGALKLDYVVEMAAEDANGGAGAR